MDLMNRISNLRGRVSEFRVEREKEKRQKVSGVVMEVHLLWFFLQGKNKIKECLFNVLLSKPLHEKPS